MSAPTAVPTLTEARIRDVVTRMEAHGLHAVVGPDDDETQLLGTIGHLQAVLREGADDLLAALRDAAGSLPETDEN